MNECFFFVSYLVDSSFTAPFNDGKKKISNWLVVRELLVTVYGFTQLDSRAPRLTIQSTFSCCSFFFPAGNAFDKRQQQQLSRKHFFFKYIEDAIIRRWKCKILKNKKSRQPIWILKINSLRLIEAPTKLNINKSKKKKKKNEIKFCWPAALDP